MTELNNLKMDNELIMDSNSPSPIVEQTNTERTFNMFVSQTLSKNVPVTTGHYRVTTESDGHGCLMEVIDLSDTDLKSAFENDQHYTPLELITFFKEFLEVQNLDFFDAETLERNNHLIEECKYWIEDDFEIMENF